MVSPNSRRAFLLGRRTPPTSWGAFCARLSRTCSGNVHWHKDPDRHQAWLVPAREADVLHAHALCREYGVKIALAEASAEILSDGTPNLMIEAGAAWASLTQVGDCATLWRADAGCSMARVQALGVTSAQSADPALNVAQWLACAASARWPTGQGMQSGIERVQIMLADGTVEVLGPFGADAVTPLRSLTVQKMVPRLFELAGSADAMLCAQAALWPARFRLDALMPAEGGEVNLAWLMTGHGGSLAWVQAVWFRTTPPRSLVSQPSGSAEHVRIAAVARELDRQLKACFDPLGVFPSIPPSKGLESAS